jgi:hypothetical protein
MTFILRIFFSGLITFVPSQNGKQLTVLLLNAGHATHAAGEATLPEHKALLLARGGNCDGDCVTRDTAAAQFLYPEVDSEGAASDSLLSAVSGGTVWDLTGSQLSFVTPQDGVTLVKSSSLRGKRVPNTPDERADFGWVPNLKEIWPASGGLNPAVFAPNPPEDLIAARLVLESGTVSTYSVIEIGGKVLPVEFRPLSGTARAPFQRAAANWVEAEVRVPGNDVEIVAESFKGGAKRTIKLTPQNGVVEVVVLNISRPLPGNRQAAGRPGVHFERYWSLVQHPPAMGKRPIPQAPQNQLVKRDWGALHPADGSRASILLDRLLFPGGRSPYDQLLCPMSQYP